MFFVDLLFALAIALLLTGIFGAGPRWQRDGTALLMFLIVLFLATWAGGVWITFIGPPLWGSIHWLSSLIVGLLFVFLLRALILPARHPHTRRGAVQGVQAETDAEAALDPFFWILIAGLVIAILVYYL